MLDGVTYYFLDNEYYFKRGNPYGYFDDAERMAFFSKAVVEAMQFLPAFFPDVLHCNDWHTALAPVYLREQYQGSSQYRAVRVVLTVHNLKYQGVFSDSVLGNVLGLDAYPSAVDQLRWHDGAVNFMQAGLRYADRLTRGQPHLCRGSLHVLLRRGAGRPLPGAPEHPARHSQRHRPASSSTRMTDAGMPAHFSAAQSRREDRLQAGASSRSWG